MLEKLQFPSPAACVPEIFISLNVREETVNQTRQPPVRNCTGSPGGRFGYERVKQEW